MTESGNAADGAWEKHVDESSDTPYYYNTVTGESSWDVPESYVEKHETEKERKTPKWRKYADDETGKEYYVDSANDVTQWERPEDFRENEDEDKEYEDAESQATEPTPEKQNESVATNEETRELDPESIEPEKPAHKWVKHMDRASGKPYYYDTITNVTQWDEPESFEEAPQLSAASLEYQEYLSRTRTAQLTHATQQALDPSGNLKRLNAILSGIGSNAAAAPEASADDETAEHDTIQNPDWQQHVDPHSSRCYYYNTVTGVTQWDKPDAPVSSALADWIPAEDPNDRDTTKQKTVSGVDYAVQAKFNRITGKYEQLGGDDYWNAVGVAPDRAGRQMSHFFNINELEKNREQARIVKEQLKRKNIDWKKVAAEKKAKKQKQKNEWIYQD